MLDWGALVAFDLVGLVEGLAAGLGDVMDEVRGGGLVLPSGEEIACRAQFELCWLLLGLVEGVS